MTLVSIDVASLQPFCQAVRFKPGEILRHKGQHYTDAYLMLDGSVAVDRKTKGSPEIVVAGAGCPIGEIGFLRPETIAAGVDPSLKRSELRRVGWQCGYRGHSAKLRAATYCFTALTS